MRVHHGDAIGPGAQHFGMDEYFIVASGITFDLVALEIDGDDVVFSHFFETDTRRLHEKTARLIRQAQRDMAGDIVALPFMREHTARISKQALERVHVNVGRERNAKPFPARIPASSNARAGRSWRPLRALEARR